MIRSIVSRLHILALGPAIALALGAGSAQAQQGKLEAKTFERIGKEKIQVDLSLADTGVLYRELRDYLKEVLEARGNPIGRSGPIAAKLNINYAQPIEPSGSAGPGASISGPSTSGPTAGSVMPDRTAPAFRRPDIAPPRGNAMHIGITIYRERGGKVLWTGEATCTVAFAIANDAGRAMIVQLVELIDKNRKATTECPN